MPSNGIVFVICKPSIVSFLGRKTGTIGNPKYIDMIAKVDDVLEAGKRSIGIAQAANVTICYGSDLLAEMRKYQLAGLGLLGECGMEALHVLQSATINAARLVCLESTIGTIEEGKVADMILLMENPLLSTKAFDNPRQFWSIFRAGDVIQLDGPKEP